MKMQSRRSKLVVTHGWEQRVKTIPLQHSWMFRDLRRMSSLLPFMFNLR